MFEPVEVIANATMASMFSPADRAGPVESPSASGLPGYGMAGVLGERLVVKWWMTPSADNGRVNSRQPATSSINPVMTLGMAT
jgi:hypothetical protein